MENAEQARWAKIIAIGCSGCLSCLGVLGFVAVFNEGIIELGEAVESMDNLSIPIDIGTSGGSTEWDGAQVKAILVTHFDKDQSGLINFWMKKLRPLNVMCEMPLISVF